jgi:predicted metal-dependent HD superfamily phosphohydrolase
MVAAFIQALLEFTAADEQTQSDAAAWLHDVIEDTHETAEGLRAAGISERAVANVVALTRTEEVTAADYYANIGGLPVARLVKTADLASNLAPKRVAQLDEHTRERPVLKYGHALEALGVDRSVIIALHAGRPAQ